MRTIHPKWTRPMPRYWHDFADKDAPQLDADWQPPEAVLPPGPERDCIICGTVFTPHTLQGTHRQICYDRACLRARKRLNRLDNERRKAAEQKGAA